jgi:pimeloyl-ACP methyl ester carboxylesterase
MREEIDMSDGSTSGYAPVNGVDVYWESRGRGGTPLIVVHGGFGLASLFGELLDRLAAHRRVVAVELQGHGHTRDIDRPFSFAEFGRQIIGVADHLGFEQVDLLGYSLGAMGCLHSAFQDPDRVRRLALVSIPCRRDGWFPEVLAGMARVNRSQFEQMSQSSMYAAWLAVAPDPTAFPSLMDKTGALVSQSYDWTDEVSRLTCPTLLVYGDADSIPPAHAAEFYALLGGGLRDADWDGSGATAMHLAILPGLTHYNVFAAPVTAKVVDDFLS